MKKRCKICKYLKDGWCTWKDRKPPDNVDDMFGCKVMFFDRHWETKGKTHKEDRSIETQRKIQEMRDEL